jgi:hypothetical protein
VIFHNRFRTIPALCLGFHLIANLLDFSQSWEGFPFPCKPQNPTDFFFLFSYRPARNIPDKTKVFHFQMYFPAYRERITNGYSPLPMMLHPPSGMQREQTSMVKGKATGITDKDLCKTANLSPSEPKAIIQNVENAIHSFPT